MKIVKNDNVYRFHKGDVEVLEKLPAQTYIIRFHPEQGFWLEEYFELEVHEQKVYGVHEEKVQKVINRFKQFERNLGIILSGGKGIGKSLFARMVGQAATSEGYPVIVVDRYVQGIHSFIEEIEQEVVILFDEFDKKFHNNENRDNNQQTPQASLLSLLDGVSSGKKMFIVTCNGHHTLSEYLINRPGRFHFHFKINCPSAEEIKVYLQDKLDEKYWEEIPKVVSFSMKVELNYDCLRAIVFEIQQGETFESAIKDLNIVNVEIAQYEFSLRFNDGTILYNNYQGLDWFVDEQEKLMLYNHEGFNCIGVEFNPRLAVHDESKGCSIVTGDNLKIFYERGFGNEEEEAYIKRIKGLLPDRLEIKRVPRRGIHYVV